MKKFYIHTMGCKSNQFETQIIKENLIKHGLEETHDIKTTDFYILNSCSVTHKSDNEAFYHLRAAKRKNSNVITVLTGCIAQIERDKLLENEFINYVIGNDEKLKLYDYINSNTRICVGDVSSQENFSEIELQDTSKTRISLKIQDGCNNRCSYCIIWKARGKSRSASLEFIINQINKFAESGYKEVVLTGIHIGQWGKDIGLKLTDLLNAIEFETKIPRYRLGSLNPTEINDELLIFLQKSQKFCPHFHLSLQSANDKTLKSMNRFYKTDLFLKQIEQINSMFELPFIGSDIITGFAGETDEDFEVTVKNLTNSGLTQIHTFPYSVRKGTLGADMPFQVEESIKNRRATMVKQISKDKFENFIQKNLGKHLEVLIEKHRDKHTKNLKGITKNYITVQIISNREDLYNSLQTAKLTKFENNIVYAEFI